MALDVQWLRMANSASHCLVGALRNGYLWVGDVTSACMGAIETPLSALSCVTAWHNASGSFAAAAGQGSNVFLYSIAAKEVSGPPPVEDASASASFKKKKKKVRCQCSVSLHVCAIRLHLQVGMRHVSADIQQFGCVCLQHIFLILFSCNLQAA